MVRKSVKQNLKNNFCLSFDINATQYWCQLFRTFEELPFGNQADKFGLSTRYVVDVIFPLFYAFCRSLSFCTVHVRKVSYF